MQLIIIMFAIGLCLAKEEAFFTFYHYNVILSPNCKIAQLSENIILNTHFKYIYTYLTFDCINRFIDIYVVGNTRFLIIGVVFGYTNTVFYEAFHLDYHLCIGRIYWC